MVVLRRALPRCGAVFHKTCFRRACPPCFSAHATVPDALKRSGARNNLVAEEGVGAFSNFRLSEAVADVPGKLGVPVLFGSHILSEKAFCPLEQL